MTYLFHKAVVQYAISEKKTHFKGEDVRSYRCHPPKIISTAQGNLQSVDV